MEEQTTLHERMTAISVAIIDGIPYHSMMCQIVQQGKLYIDCFKKDSEDYNISQKNQYLTKINVFFFCQQSIAKDDTHNTVKLQRKKELKQAFLDGPSSFVVNDLCSETKGSQLESS